jgi:ATP-dependent DNA helicase RecG
MRGGRSQFGMGIFRRCIPNRRASEGDYWLYVAFNCDGDSSTAYESESRSPWVATSDGHRALSSNRKWHRRIEQGGLIVTSSVSNPTPDDEIIDRLLALPESYKFDCKRIIGKVDKLLECVIAFANADGAVIALGLEDPAKAAGRTRVYGLEENMLNWDELLRKLKSRVTEAELLPVTSQTIPCTLRDGTRGSIGVIRIEKSPRIHSIVDNGTYVRLQKGNKEITASEINDLSFARGTISAESQLVDVDFELLDSIFWKTYAEQRGITRPLEDALYTIGLAKKLNNGTLKPTMAAVLLFAEEPSGVLAGKTSIRIFHYHGLQVSTDPNTNLTKPPITVGGPVIQQIRDARQAVIRELGERVQYTDLGFEIVQKYPLRVVTEAITNAVIHRDYRIHSDILVRIFSDRMEVESPGLLVGPVTAANIGRAGTHPRNKLIVQHLREFPAAPNLDAGEGVRMMFGTMRKVGLYPPQYWTRPRIEREAVVTVLFNQNRPTVWEQVVEYLERHGSIGNAEVRRLLGTNDTLGVSKQLKHWVEQGLLIVANPEAGRNVRRYSLSSTETDLDFFSNLLGKEPDETP